MGNVFLVFLRLGLTAFGGPVAHIGFFRDEFVARRKWLSDAAYADLVALCQFLPGPASSQVGLAIGLMRAGPGGAFAAWLGFTLPAALLMAGAALALVQFSAALPPGLLDGIKAVVVAVVAHALLGMARALTPDMLRAALAAGAVAVVMLVGGASGQLLAIATGAVTGLLVLSNTSPAHHTTSDFAQPLSRRAGAVLIGISLVLLVLLPVLAAQNPSLPLQIADSFYRSGALVFGGGHVVLPLLQAETVAPGLVSATDFTAGYGFAQAVPGPLFSFSAFLGATASIDQGTVPALSMAALALVMIFLPGALLVAGTLPFWAHLRANATARAALTGINAAVVGILAAALYDPVATTAINDRSDIVIAAAAFVALTWLRTPAWAVVPLGALAGVGWALAT